MQQVVDQKSSEFVDRRAGARDGSFQGRERRQFSDGRESAPSDVRELAEAVDAYKVRHRRRFITYEELLQVVKELGYSR